MGSVSAKALEVESDYKHDPLEGFPNGRKPREIKTTLEEMESAKIPLDKRDYCVDYLMKFLECRNEKYPWVYKCHHEKHEYLHCQYEDYLIRMKDYERNRRLDERAAKSGQH
ncbi:NADH dehydrogenase [ubiquinone] 1 beta subcomplex subunit 7 [Daphnia magna]|uniref:NADH dehydrogenase [ubiquinone] 1 beta subcomplex subunit 7 n=2 Tax=Daphnia magna TaxID=35525 RepID=A0A0P5Z4N6_9CRUS|nr:NADH dehydrogenase [ubiquinone] 1 beta subcomplex subunit 7 [Daphnia magna]XP_032795991.1 NADH dehydrogenase [ubiquinone] 1 beta subcomplex subunit 7 [Daphnia magna]KAK4003234.1 hypothetical protein OUZ56_005013 [Daphnia magna]KZS14263.1 NADH dehydrogenase [ubiquinone] 1 beta subcomplex subunit 7 [Daphnia magna]